MRRNLGDLWEAAGEGAIKKILFTGAQITNKNTSSIKGPGETVQCRQLALSFFIPGNIHSNTVISFWCLADVKRQRESFSLPGKKVEPFCGRTQGLRQPLNFHNSSQSK